MKKSIQKVGMRVTLQCNDYTLHEGSIIASFCCKNDFLFRGWGAGKKENFKRKIYLCYLAKKKIKWRKIYCFGERGGEKNN